MDTQSHPGHLFPRPRCALLLGFLLFLLPLASVPSAAAQQPRLALVAMPVASAPVFAGAPGWWNKTWSVLERAFGDRRRMIQLAILGMIIGLFVLLRR